MDGDERIRIEIWKELPFVGVCSRSAKASGMVAVSPDELAALRAALRDAGVTAGSRMSLFVLDTATGEGTTDLDGNARVALTLRIEGDPERLVVVDSAPRLCEAIRHVHLGKPHPDILQFNVSRRARPLLQALRDFQGRASRRHEVLHDPEYRTNVHATALAVALAVLGLGFALQPLFRAN